jgi:hypothetical protein
MSDSLEDFEFTDEQWHKITTPLGKGNVQPKDRQVLVWFVRSHARNRQVPYITPAYARKRLQGISAAAAKLRRAILDNDDDHFADLDLPKAMFKGDFKGKAGFERLQWAWFAFIKQLDVLEKTSAHIAQYYVGKKAEPANVDVARNYTLKCLAGIYERITGKEAAVWVATDTFKDGTFAGKAIGPFVEFVQAFMGAIPNEPIPTGDQIKWFLVQRKRKRNGEGASKKI